MVFHQPASWLVVTSGRGERLEQTELTENRPRPLLTCLPLAAAMLAAMPARMAHGLWRPERTGTVHSMWRAQQANKEQEQRQEVVEERQLELACLPWRPGTAHIVVPGCTKSVHLKAARLAELGLVEHVTRRPDRLLVDMSATQATKPSLCLCRLEAVEWLDKGDALLTVRALARLSLLSLTQTHPLVQLLVAPMLDDPVGKEQEQRDLAVGVAAEELKNTLAQLHYLELKLEVRSLDQPLQTPLQLAMLWAEAGVATPLPPPPPAFLPCREERLSFAALQPVEGSSPADLHALLHLRLKAMESTDTLQRLTDAMSYGLHARASLAAKLALQSLNLT